MPYAVVMLFPDEEKAARFCAAMERLDQIVSTTDAAHIVTVCVEDNGAFVAARDQEYRILGSDDVIAIGDEVRFFDFSCTGWANVISLYGSVGSTPKAARGLHDDYKKAQWRRKVK